MINSYDYYFINTYKVMIIKWLNEASKHISHLKYLLISIVRSFEIYFLGDFEIYNILIVLSTLYNVSQCKKKKFSCLIKSMFLLATISHSLTSPPASGEYHSTLFFEFGHFRLSCVVRTCSNCLLCLVSFT